MTDRRPTYEELLTENAALKARCAWRGAFGLIGWALLAAVFLLFTLARPAHAGAQSPAMRAAANADRQTFATSEWPYIFYLCLDALPVPDRAAAGRVTYFTLASFSRAVVLEQQLPTAVAPCLYRIDLRGLEWAAKDWHKVLEGYPYAPESRPLPLIVRADWLVVELADAVESDAGERLLYGAKKIPATLSDFESFWNVRKGREELALFNVQDEAGPGVREAQIRWIENADTADRGFYWQTQDNAARNETTATDPLESLLDRNRPRDASEHIVGFIKTSIAQGTGGVALAYFLANDKEVSQTRAPVDIVRDATHFRGLDEIRKSGSCIQCHVEGIRPLPPSSLRERIAAGTDLYADKKSQALIEQQYLAETRLKIEQTRATEDYTAFVVLAAGWSAEDNARAFRLLVDAYDAPLGLEECARELYVKPNELTLAFGYASQKQIKIGARLAGVVHGQTIPRAYFESQYSVAWSAVQLWKKVGGKP